MSNSRKSRFENNENYTKVSTGNPSVYQLNLKKTRKGHLCKKTFGKRSGLKPQNKTIMVLGATGSGKTTLINSIINYIFGIEWGNEVRLKLIDEQTNKTQAESQTSEVTAYQIYHKNGFKVDYSVTIIDTPGFGDTRGIKHDKIITDQIRQFFSQQDGILGLDAVCFVVQSALARLTQTQKYIFEAVLSIFGKDIADNIVIMITFADGQKPPVLEALAAADIPCVKKTDGSVLHFKFNNSALFADKKLGDEDEDENFDEMFWKMGKSSMKKFFTHLAKMETKSLQLTKQVLEERKQLEATVSGVQPLIKIGLDKLEEIKMTQQALEQNQDIIRKNKDFEYNVDTKKYEQVDIPTGTFITNCTACNYTCHFPCAIADDGGKGGCAAMKHGNCTVCPGKCPWKLHYNMPYRIEITTAKEKRTYENLKKQFEDALGKQMSIEKIMEQLQQEYFDVQMQVLKMNENLAKSLTRLKEIALRPDPLTTPDYIELLIESEKQTGKEGYMKRIAELEEMKQQSFILQKVERGEPLTEKEQRFRKWKKAGANSVQAIVGVFNNMKLWFKPNPQSGLKKTK